MERVPLHAVTKDKCMYLRPLPHSNEENEKFKPLFFKQVVGMHTVSYGDRGLSSSYCQAQQTYSGCSDCQCHQRFCTNTKTDCILHLHCELPQCSTLVMTNENYWLKEYQLPGEKLVLLKYLLCLPLKLDEFAALQSPTVSTLKTDFDLFAYLSFNGFSACVLFTLLATELVSFAYLSFLFFKLSTLNHVRLFDGHTH